MKTRKSKKPETIKKNMEMLFLCKWYLATHLLCVQIWDVTRWPRPSSLKEKRISLDQSAGEFLACVYCLNWPKQTSERAHKLPHGDMADEVSVSSAARDEKSFTAANFAPNPLFKSYDQAAEPETGGLKRTNTLMRTPAMRVHRRPATVRDGSTMNRRPSVQKRLLVV